MWMSNQPRLISVMTFNLNTWKNRRKGLSDHYVLHWIMTKVAADIMILTEAPIPIPQTLVNQGWEFVHRNGGMPGRTGWGTVIAVRRPFHAKHLTAVGPAQSHELDSRSPGQLTAAEIAINGECLFTAIGLHVRWRIGENDEFIGNPDYDLSLMEPDFQHLHEGGTRRLIIAGDLNQQVLQIPYSFRNLRLKDPFLNRYTYTFKPERRNSPPRKLDYMFVDELLARNIIKLEGGFEDFPDSISDHAPLMVTFDLDVFICDCGSKIRRPANSSASQIRCPKCKKSMTIRG